MNFGLTGLLINLRTIAPMLLLCCGLESAREDAVETRALEGGGMGFPVEDVRDRESKDA